MKAEVLKSFSYGMYAIGVKDKGKTSACIINNVEQISNEMPRLISVCVNRSSYSCKCIEQEGLFSISVLSQDTSAAVIGALGFNSGATINKLEDIRHKVLVEGIPVIKENTCCWFLCRVKKTLSLPEQMIFIAEIVAGSDRMVGVPMTYEYYRDVLKGTSPKKSPTYIPGEITIDNNSGESFICSVCGYVYSDPNFSFEELGEKWVCPICKMPKKAFVRK